VYFSLCVGDDSEDSDYVEQESTALELYVTQDVQQMALQSDSQSTIPTLNPTILNTLSSVFADARARMSTNVPLTATPSAATTTNNTRLLCSSPLHESSNSLPERYMAVYKDCIRHINI
jgi:hypothetical protein